MVNYPHRLNNQSIGDAMQTSQRQVTRAPRQPRGVVVSERAQKACAGVNIKVIGFPPRQTEVLLGKIAGKNEKQIAKETGIEFTTVKKHGQVILRKAGARNMPQAIANLFKLGHLQVIPVLLVIVSCIFGGDEQSRRTQTQRPQVVTVRIRESV